MICRRYSREDPVEVCIVTHALDGSVLQIPSAHIIQYFIGLPEGIRIRTGIRVMDRIQFRVARSGEILRSARYLLYQVSSLDVCQNPTDGSGDHPLLQLLSGICIDKESKEKLIVPPAQHRI